MDLYSVWNQFSYLTFKESEYQTVSLIAMEIASTYYDYANVNSRGTGVLEASQVKA